MLGEVKLETSKFSKTFLISADFADAFTETRIPSIQDSISVIGSIVGCEKEKIDLMVNLVDLVFNNCYFL